MNTAVSIPVFKQRQQRWFKKMIGEKVFCEATKFTSSQERQKLVQVKVVADEKHARSLYVYHKDHKINFTEYKG